MLKLSLEEGFKENIRRIVLACNEQEQMIVELNAGGSASGKSTDVRNIEAELRRRGIDVLTLSADNYYVGGKKVREMSIDFDDPRAVDLELLKNDISLLKEGKSIKEKIYAFGEDPWEETGKILKPPKVLIVEGLFVLLDEKMRDLADIKIFYNIGLHGWILRRIFRDTARTGMRPADILSYCTGVVEPRYRQWVLNTMQFANIVINNEYNPKIEAENAGRHENQLKYRSSMDESELIHRLHMLGADRLAIVEQTDTYYDPKDRSLKNTGESMRIREEGNRRIWTYKGPKKEDSPDNAKRKYKNQDDSISIRSKYEFELSKSDANQFFEIYGKEIKVVKKVRTLFHLGSLVISVDNVIKVENGIEEDLGIFVEFRTNTKISDTTILALRIKDIMNKIDLESAEAENRSYVEM